MNPSALRVIAGAALLVGASIAVAACTAVTPTREERSYGVAAAVTALRVRATAGTVEIVAGSGPVTVHETVLYTRDRPRTSHRTDGGTLTVEATGCSRRGFNQRCDTDVRIQVPPSTEVTVEADAGRVTVRGITAQLTVNVDGGSVTGSDLAGPTIVRSAAGGIELRFRQPPPSVHTTNDAGSTRIYLPPGRYDIDAGVDAGRATVTLPSDPTATSK